MFGINNHYSEAHSAIPTTSVFTSVNDVPFLPPSDENSGDRAEFYVQSQVSLINGV